MICQQLDQDFLVVGTWFLQHPKFGFLGQALPRGLERVLRQVQQAVLFADRKQLMMTTFTPPIFEFLYDLRTFSQTGIVKYISPDWGPRSGFSFFWLLSNEVDCFANVQRFFLISSLK